jgi:hypothetical protein
MCRVDNNEFLPSTYHKWDARPRRVSERYVLQQAVDAASATLGVPSFEVTPTKVMSFNNFRFVGAAYHVIGTGLLPFGITPSDATSTHARAMLAVDRTQADAFNLGGDPENGAIAPGDISRLRNLSGYTPQSWMEAHTQLHSIESLMGTLLGGDHPVVEAYGRFLRKYGRLMTLLESEVDQVHGRRIGPSLVTFHIQLMWRNSLAAQLDAVENMWVDPPCVWCGSLYDGGPEKNDVVTTGNQRPLGSRPLQHPPPPPAQLSPSPRPQLPELQSQELQLPEPPLLSARWPLLLHPPAAMLGDRCAAQTAPQVRGQHPLRAKCALQGRL